MKKKYKSGLVENGKVEKKAANRGKITALLKTQASVVPFLFEDWCSFADFKEAIQNIKAFALFYEQSRFNVTLDSDGWEAFLYHIRSLKDKTVTLKALASNSPKSALTSLLSKATDGPNLELRDIGMPSTSRNDTGTLV